MVKIPSHLRLYPILALFILSLTIIYGQSQQQSVTLYSGQNCHGQSFYTKNYVPDLGTVNFDNRARSARIQGTWLFYDLPYYNLWREAPMEYFVIPNGCHNFQNLAGLVSSLRFAGNSRNYATDSITLYTGTFFQGVEEFTQYDLANLNLDGQITSLIITGVTAWTVYDQPKFGGNGKCVHPPSHSGPAFVTSIADIQIPHGTIRSVRRGCHGKDHVYVDEPTSFGNFFNLTETKN